MWFIAKFLRSSSPSRVRRMRETNLQVRRKSNAFFIGFSGHDLSKANIAVGLDRHESYPGAQASTKKETAGPRCVKLRTYIS